LSGELQFLEYRNQNLTEVCCTSPASLLNVLQLRDWVWKRDFCSSRCET